MYTKRTSVTSGTLVLISLSERMHVNTFFVLQLSVYKECALFVFHICNNVLLLCRASTAASRWCLWRASKRSSS